MKITNLDVLHETDDREITLAGKNWIIPGDIPVKMVLSLIDLQQKLESNPTDFDLWEKQIDIIYKALKLRQPELTKEELEEFMTAKQMGALIGLLMSTNQDEQEEKKTELSESKEESQK